MANHSDKYIRSDRRSLAMHRLIAGRLRAAPGLLAVARTNIARWRGRNSFPQPYLDDWERILDAGLDEVLRLIESETEEAARLRSSTPFAGILTPRERWEFLREWNEANSNI